MRDFIALIFDDRYRSPTFRLFEASDEGTAQEVARRILEESVHHLGLEIWENDRLFSGGPADYRAASLVGASK
jgi:hypothetical protein